MSHVNSQAPRRRYESPLRAENARRTRDTIITAASELFTARGYSATSLADVAVAAGVARPTVFAAFGSKSALLRVILDQALAGDDELVPVADRPWFRPVWDAATQDAALDAYARVCVLIEARTARIFEAVRRAADASSEVAQLWNTVQGNRRAGAEMVVKRLQALGPLRPGLDSKGATDLLWVFNDPAHFSSLVHDCGWEEAAFARWLSSHMRYAVLHPPQRLEPQALKSSGHPDAHRAAPRHTTIE